MYICAVCSCVHHHNQKPTGSKARSAGSATGVLPTSRLVSDPGKEAARSTRLTTRLRLSLGAADKGLGRGHNDSQGFDGEERRGWRGGRGQLAAAQIFKICVLKKQQRRHRRPNHNTAGTQIQRYTSLVCAVRRRLARPRAGPVMMAFSHPKRKPTSL